MKFTVQREVILKALQNLVGITEKKQTLPILANVLLELTGDTLRLTATNIEIEENYLILVNNIASIDKNIIVSGKKLFDICRVAPEGKLIEFSLSDNYLYVDISTSRFSLVALDGAKFPTVLSFDKEKAKSIYVSGNVLSSLFLSVQFAIAQQHYRQYLNGLSFNFKDGILSVLASDAHRMAINKIDLESEQKDTCFNIILPRRSVAELIKVFVESNSLVQISVIENYVRLETEGFSFTSKLIEGTFPDLEKNIPANFKYEIVIEKEIILKALERVLIISSDIYSSVELVIKSDSMVMTTFSSEHEKACESIAIKSNVDEEMTVSFNISYLLDAVRNLKSSSTKELKMRFNSAQDAVVVSENDELKKALYLLMPLKQ